MASRNRTLQVRAIGRFVSEVAFGASLCAGYGCAALDRDLQKDGAVRLELAPSEIATVSRVRVYEDEGDLIVYGKIGRKAGVKGRMDAMVRVIIQYPDGRTLEETKRAFPPHLPIKSSRKSNFTVHFPGLPANGARVRIECPTESARAPVSLPTVASQETELRR